MTNRQVDQKLIEEALSVSKDLTPNQLIEDALREYIQRRQQLKVLDLFGTIDYEEDYDYKQQRQKR
ncbi:MAG: type II toxin-antitoxin system VapB family antitoxin [Chroococcales cyanobacterium]